MTRKTHQVRSWLTGRVARALLVGLAYYAGAWVGFATTFPDTGISIVWPPNTILLAALLVTPKREWWPYGATTLVAHVLAHGQVGVPLIVLLIQFGGNAAQAVVAALLLRRLTETPWRHTLRSAVALIAVAGVVAPAVASVLAAHAYVLAGWLPTFTAAWRVRVLGNLVTTLTLAPLLISVASQGLRGLSEVQSRRVGEFAAVVAGMLVGTALVAQSAVRPDERWLLYAPMPLLLWAAVRFGPPGLSVTLFVIVFMFIGHPFGGPSIATTAADNAFALQVFLVAIAVPLQLLAALVEERRCADDEVAESQRRYQMATQAGGVGVWDWDLETNRIYVDPMLMRTLGYADHQGPTTMEIWGALVHPDDAPRVWAEVQAHLDGLAPQFSVEHRMLCRDGSVRWFLARGAVSARRQGRPVRMTGTDTDITDRKAAEEALDHSSRRIRELTGQLLFAQEEERRHIARELHDDLSQQVAGLAIAISGIRRDLGRGGDADPVLAGDLDVLRGKTIELAEGMRELSHGLHPAALEHGGLAAGLKSFAADFSQREGVQVALSVVGKATTIAPHVALALYRIVQESLRNVARHSSARRAEVSVTIDDARVEILVKDQGSGFDVAGVRHGKGLGLVSIEERARLLEGTLLVNSRPGQGTELLVRIPLTGSGAGSPTGAPSATGPGLGAGVGPEGPDAGRPEAG
jgi:two-component system sensor histidine kinase UhpB